MFLAINKKTKFIYTVPTVEEAALTVEAHGADLHWQLKRTGRWDSPDFTWVVIPTQPEEE